MTRAHRPAAAALLVGTAAAACLLAGAPAVAHPAATSPRGLTIRLLDQPTALAKDPRAAAYVIDELRPGTTIVRHVEVTNDTTAPTTVSLFPSAATIGGGDFTIAPGAARNEITGWTTITPTSLPLAVGAHGDATVTITVPADATSGERYEGLVAALPAAKQASGLLLENRVAIRTYLAVSSSRAPVPAPDFTIGSLQAARAADGTPTVTATVTNTGGRALDLTGTLLLTHGPGGVSAGPFQTGGASTLGVGASGTVFVRLDKALPAGPWDARIAVTSGLLTRAATGVITFPTSAGTSAAPVRAHAVGGARHSVFVPVAGGLLGLIVLGLLLVLWWRRRRRDDEPPAAAAPDRVPTPIPAQAAPARPTPAPRR